MQLRNPRLLASAGAFTLVAAVAGSASADTITFRNGLNGYASTVNGFVRQLDPATPRGEVGGLQVSGAAFSGGRQQTLIRFENLFGSGTNQVPVGSTINSATFVMPWLQFGGGNPTNTGEYYAMAETWMNPSWNSFDDDGVGLGTDTGGVTPGDDAFATPIATAVRLGGTAVNNIDVTAQVQGYAAGTLGNFGFMIQQTDNTKTSSVFANSAGGNNPDTDVSRPALLVDFTPAAVPEPASLALLGAGAGLALLRRRQS